MSIQKHVLASSTTGMAPLAMLTFTVLLPIALIGLGIWASSIAPDTTPTGNIVAFTVLGSVVALMVALGFIRAKITVYEDRIELRMTPLYVRQVPLDLIKQVRPVQLGFWRYSLGWRIYGSGEMGLISRNSTGLYIEILPRGGYYVSVANQSAADRIIGAVQDAQVTR